ncbi:MAG TPA: tRNA lysidine(34) synthetase TilS [Geobacteraceae bacterium]|nr:tRNA lysidine(34) synthetase TilS [Geobacteraceae bacterium]
MLKKVMHFIEENSLFAPGDTVVAAVSGGADSVALLDILVSLRELRLNLVAAHLNHLLRGAEADADEEFVRKLAASYGVPVVVKRVDVGEFARREGRSLEDAGRAARYAFFAAVAALHNAHAVALAHHADDQAETVMMRLLRGAGGSGLCAMAPKSADLYVRPFLSVNRGEIEAYLQKRGIAWRTDSSNAAADFLRNRIRHELIPYLARYNPAISERLSATAEALAADEEFLDSATAGSFARHAVLSAYRVILALPGLRSEPRAIRLRLYRRAILQAKGDLARIGFCHLRAIDCLVFSSKPHLTLDLPDRLRAAKSYGDISFSAGEDNKPLFFGEIYLDGPGIYPLPGSGMLAVDFADATGDLKSAPAATAYFDLDRAPFPWRVRTFKPGDRFSPFGMTGHKKVKELFIDAKVPLAFRRRIPILFCGETLLWVVGIRRSNAASLTTGTKTVVRAGILDFTP